jgi:ATP-dependent Lhr-like helicase
VTAPGPASPGRAGWFHPAVAAWFERRFPTGPTPAQAQGWPPIRAGRHTLIAAPTGSGKTLAAFLECIDSLYRAWESGQPLEGVQVVYVSPLKALGVDVAHNLRGPLAEIEQVAAGLGLELPGLRVEVRNGDTPASVRQAMVRRPPHILVTTPESLYLMVTAARTRGSLGGVGRVVVDEIHAVAKDKRGAHLALTLERLAHLCPSPPQRIGLSATQRPVSTVARLLVGAGPQRSRPDGSPDCSVVDVGHRRPLDLDLEVPGQELGAVASAEQMAEILDRVAAHVAGHRTTLVFVNTRRLAERVAHQLAERLGPDAVAAHHGSLSRERRLKVESRLRAGELKALVATASLELGIDVGPVELVCQLGSPRSLASFLQRVGRSGHGVGRLPKGRLYPTTRDELVECAALLAGVRRGRLDAVALPDAPLDILAQQVVAECAAEAWSEDGLYELVRRAAPYADLSRSDYEDVLELVCEGILTGRGRRAAWVRRDRVNRVLSGRRGARLAALTSGGAIPEQGDYKVVAEPDGATVGTVNEDWAVESMAGDVFLLGTHSWRIRRVEPGVVRVSDAEGAPPSIPFWLGEAPARTDELSEEVSRLRQGVAERLAVGSPERARAWVAAASGLGAQAADQLVSYLEAGRAQLGLLPTARDLVLERFFDETGGMQLVVHCPLGARVNRALGLALRKRFCVSFDFELQAAASDDAVALSLGPQHSFRLESVMGMLKAPDVGQVLAQAVLGSPMFSTRWRWNLNRALVVLRARGGRRNPPAIQRMEADDLMAAVFPALAACQENAPAGPVEIPDHPLVRQTLDDCLHEAMDVDGLARLLEEVAAGEVAVHVRDVVEPSVLSHEILSGRPYTYLDDAPLEERRTRAVPLRQGLPLEPEELGRLDPEALEQVAAEVAPDPRGPDELADLLAGLVVCPPRPDWQGWFEELVAGGRAASLDPAGAGPLWVATEARELADALFPGAPVSPDVRLPGRPRPEREEAAAQALRGHLEVGGPATPAELAGATGLDPAAVAAGLARLEAEGSVLAGRFRPGRPAGEEEYWARRLLARAHHHSRRGRRRALEPVSAQAFMRFLLAWQRVAPGTQAEGPGGVAGVVGQLQGYEVAAGAWEREVLARRVFGYRPEWLDRLGTSGELAWGRLSLRQDAGPRPGRRAASRATPVSLARRADLGWLLQAARGTSAPEAPPAGAARDVLDALAARGALFRGELARAAGRLPAEVDEALWDGVARGLVTADSFGALRCLLSPRARWERSRGGLGPGRLSGEGRWSLLPPPEAADAHDLAEAVAAQLLARWGVVFYQLLAKESFALPWREVLWALRRLEARGQVLGGRFVAGFSGEQYALPEAADSLRRWARAGPSGEVVRICAADPLNLVGVVLPGSRVPAVATNYVAYRDGALVEAGRARPARRRARRAAALPG